MRVVRVFIREADEITGFSEHRGSCMYARSAFTHVDTIAAAMTISAMEELLNDILDCRRHTYVLFVYAAQIGHNHRKYVYMYIYYRNYYIIYILIHSSIYDTGLFVIVNHGKQIIRANWI